MPQVGRGAKKTNSASQAITKVKEKKRAIRPFGGKIKEGTKATSLCARRMAEKPHELFEMWSKKQIPYRIKKGRTKGGGTY